MAISKPLRTFVPSLKPNEMKKEINTQLLDIETRTTETYKVEVDGKLYIYVSHLNPEGTEEDFALRTENGNTLDEIENAELIEAIQNHLDSI